MFSHWSSDWETKRGKRFRNAIIGHGDDQQAITLILPDHTAPEQLAKVEDFFESGPSEEVFDFRSGVVDPDACGALLMEVHVSDIRVELDVYSPGFDPEPGVFIGMGAD